MNEYESSERRVLWPDPKRGPWLLKLRFAPVRGRVEPVSLEIRSYREEDHPQLRNPKDARLPKLGDSDALSPVTSSLLRELTAPKSAGLPFGAVVRKLRSQWIRSLRYASEDSQDPTSVWARLHPGPTEERELLESARKSWGAAQTSRGRKPTLGPEHFARVAAVYRDAFKKGLPPTLTVAKKVGGSPQARSAAAKWVARARELGLLEKTTQGRSMKPARKEKARKR
jgi:hypothetical protein